jgi:ATP-dependent Clp protease adaptor protein ClpS
MKPNWEQDEDIMVEDKEDIYFESSLVVLNDDVNTFEGVISALMEILNHSSEQAEQCAWIVHTKGKCSVKNGSYEKLKPYKDAITERGIGAIIESI